MFSALKLVTLNATSGMLARTNAALSTRSFGKVNP